MAADLKKWALMAEIIGGTGIIFSMVYLAYEVSQNTANIQASNALAISSETIGTRAVHIDNAEVSEIIRKGMNDIDSLSQSEQFRFIGHALNRFLVWENLVLMDEKGLLPTGFSGPGEAGFCVHMNTSGYRWVWETWAVQYSSATLIDHVEACFRAD